MYFTDYHPNITFYSVYLIPPSRDWNSRKWLQQKLSGCLCLWNVLYDVYMQSSQGFQHFIYGFKFAPALFREIFESTGFYLIMIMSTLCLCVTFTCFVHLRWCEIICFCMAYFEHFQKRNGAHSKPLQWSCVKMF